MVSRQFDRKRWEYEWDVSDGVGSEQRGYRDERSVGEWDEHWIGQYRLGEQEECSRCAADDGAIERFGSIASIWCPFHLVPSWDNAHTSGLPMKA